MLLCMCVCADLSNSNDAPQFLTAFGVLTHITHTLTPQGCTGHENHYSPDVDLTRLLCCKL